MGKKLYVGNLSFSTTNAELETQFAQCGTVDSARIIIDKMTNRSKGFAFIEMSSDEEAEAAITKFNGYEIGGRQLKVSEAKPQEDRSSSFGGGQSRGGFGGGNQRRNGRF